VWFVLVLAQQISQLLESVPSTVNGSLGSAPGVASTTTSKLLQISDGGVVSQYGHFDGLFRGLLILLPQTAPVFWRILFRSRKRMTFFNGTGRPQKG
jgi:hypothetical protein